MREFTIELAGEKITIPSENWLLNQAEQFEGVNHFHAMATQKLGLLLQGVITVYLQSIGRQITFDEVGRLSDFNEGFMNLCAFSKALTPDVSAPKQERQVKQKNPSPGAKSKATPTDS